MNFHNSAASSDLLAYLSFDTVPAPKGAAIHIGAFVQSLAQGFGSVQLVTVSATPERTTAEPWPQVSQTALPAIGKTLIDRVLHFRQELGIWLQGRRFQVIHIRSIYEGFPIVQHKSRWCDFLVFEVNGLPSIELKYRYPDVVDDRELMQKLLAQEQICLEAADLIITPSRVTRAYLEGRGVAPGKIRVIPNGVDLEIFQYQAPLISRSLEMDLICASQIHDSQIHDSQIHDSQIRDKSRIYGVLYFGTLAGWQGVGLAVEALGLFCRDFPGDLTIVGPSRPSQVAGLRQLAQKLDLTDRVQILGPMTQAELVGQMHQAAAIVAPLTANDRNQGQGCCPLKILEAMASGTPVIATDLPVVRELGRDGEHFLLVKPGSAKGIKDAMVQLQTEPDLGSRLSQAARQRIEHHYTWQQAGAALIKAYEGLGIRRAITD
ncbi:glycosyl transferase family 1 [Leptolyngbya sp. 'hensonii']|uniref:glycosyltransferase family 4 protein n=1 Tax=Leptolyngbya sp. 'hensonii' TaxID=1922337 RepID=UPI00094F93E6|nr:glycosyltransferase family 4 protein [Leptolyngbya sp. 'hensonii']OLP16084.1 glycosyl transferase family 1 [Leptolyngbya sp. 'hensonii']